MSEPRVTVTVRTLEGARIVHVKDDKWITLDGNGKRISTPAAFWERHRARGRVGVRKQ